MDEGEGRDDKCSTAETVAMEAGSFDDDDVNSFDETIIHSNYESSCRELPQEITIHGATSLRCNPGLFNSEEGLVDTSDHLNPLKCPMPGRKSPQLDYWSAVARTSSDTKLGEEKVADKPPLVFVSWGTDNSVDSVKEAEAKRLSTSTGTQNAVSFEVVDVLVTEEEVEDKLSRETREKKACKDDKAPVPKFLWEEHLVGDAPTEWTTGQQEGLARAMDIARSWGLRWWKKSLVKSYRRWSRSKHRKDVASSEAWDKAKGTSY